MKKSSNSTSSVLIQILVIGMFLCVGSLCANVFKTYPDYKIYLGGYSPTVVKISYDQLSVAVGFSNGTVSVYNTSGSYKYSLYGHNYSIVAIEEIRGNGWVTLDSIGKASRWNTSGYVQYTWNFISPAIDVSVTWQTYGYAYIGFNFGNVVLEYSSSSTSNLTTRVYYPQTYTSFVKIQYSGYYNELFAATNTSYVHVYNCSSGNYTYSSIYVSYNVKAFNTMSNGDMVLVNNYYLYKFNSSAYYTSFYISTSMNTVAASYKDYKAIFITANVNSSSFMYVYDSNGYLKQSLGYGSYLIRAIDASNNYLVMADAGGYLSIITYSNQNDIVIDGFPGWAIALISSTLFLICFIGVVIMIVRARKRRLALAAVNGYNRFNDPQPTQQYFPNNQPFNSNPQPYVPSNQPYVQPIQPNQGWNANQAWINNQNQGINQNQNPIYVPPQSGQGSSQPNTINPYQANQPSNWS